MRARNIKPDFFRDYDLCTLDVYARVLFSGLWCLADREGRLEDCAPRIRADVFPYDDVNVEKLLEQLAERGFIKRYTVENCSRKYIQVVNFLKHQNPHKNEKPSEIPPVEDAPVISGQDREITGVNRADSLIPDSLIPDSLIDDSLITDSHKKDDGEFFNMKELLALAVKHLGWSPNLSAAGAEHLRPLTRVYRSDVARGFERASENNSKSIRYVLAAAQGHNNKGTDDDKYERLRRKYEAA